MILSQGEYATRCAKLNCRAVHVTMRTAMQFILDNYDRIGFAALRHLQICGWSIAILPEVQTAVDEVAAEARILDALALCLSLRKGENEKNDCGESLLPHAIRASSANQRDRRMCSRKRSSNVSATVQCQACREPKGPETSALLPEDLAVDVAG